MAAVAAGQARVGPSPMDQASRLRELVEALSGKARPAATSAPARRTVPVLAIASGKGGVGKTNLAVNLAIALARSGRRTTLLDADLGMANADVLCGLMPGRRLDSVLLDERAGLASCVVDAPGGFLLVPGAVGVARVADLDPASRTRLVEGLVSLETRSDIILVDTGAGIGHDVLSFAAAADRSIVVVTPEPTSIADAYGLIKCIAARARASHVARPEIEIVINNAPSRREADRVSAKLSATCERFLRFSPRVLGVIRHDDHVQRAVRARDPHLLSFPRCRASRDVIALSRRLC